MLRVPFEVTPLGKQTATGFIWLWTKDPLTVAFTKPPDRRDRASVWAAALLGFADLTVWPKHELDRTSPRFPRVGQRRRQPREYERTLPRARTYKLNHRNGLDIRALRAHVVVGHKRWLPEGWEASPEKVREAADLGITLEPGQTWVQSHLRAGHGGQRRVAVRWEPPRALRALF